MSPRDVEKVLGEGGTYQKFSNPELESSVLFISGMVRDLVPKAYFDRDNKAVAFTFTLLKTDNGGNDPRTGKPWAVTTELSRWLLERFAPAGSWAFVRKQEGGRIVKSSNGKFFALVEAQRVVITQNESILGIIAARSPR